MRAVKGALVMVAAMAALSRAVTPIGGEVREQSLNEAASPYLAEKDIVVPSGAALTIEPGTVILFKPFTGIRVEGSLVVEGTSNKPAVFTSVNDNRFGPPTGQLPNPFDWNGITLSQSCTGARLRNLHVLYGVYGINAQTANVLVEDCVFSQNGQFNLKVGEKLEYPLDNTPFTYGKAEQVSKGRAKDTPSLGARPGQGDAPKGAKVFRYVCLGSAVAGAALGTVFAAQAGNHADERDASTSPNSWDAAEQDRQSSSIGAWVSYGASVAFLGGFGVTFAF